MLYKRYQYISKQGIVWTKWFKCMHKSKKPAFKHLKEEYKEMPDGKD